MEGKKKADQVKLDKEWKNQDLEERY